MPFVLRKVFWWRRSRIPSGHGKRVNEDIQLVQSLRGGPTPTPAVNALELELAEERAKRVRLEHEHQRTKTEAGAFAEANGKLEDEIQQVKKSLEAREKELAHKDASLRQREKDMSNIQTKLAESRTAAEHARKLSAQLSEMDKLLSERTTELNAAQAFLTRADAVSEAEVVGMIENLNTLISSVSGAVSITWDQRGPVPGTLFEESGAGQIRDYFGNPMIEQIAAKNSVAINLAIQTYLGNFIERVTSGWGGGQAAGILADIYTKISTKEGQTIASRWRTLTKRYKPHQEPPQSKEIMSDLAQILMVTRTFSDFSEAMEFVGSSVETEVRAMIEATLQLGDTIKTKIASSDMAVYVVPPGGIFDEERMGDEFGEDGTREEKERWSVVGTMEIGLLRRSGNVKKVLLKPRVILEKDLVEPKGESEE